MILAFVGYFPYRIAKDILGSSGMNQNSFKSSHSEGEKDRHVALIIQVSLYWLYNDEFLMYNFSLLFVLIHLVCLSQKIYFHSFEVDLNHICTE